jgi:hypothetical protein
LLTAWNKSFAFAWNLVGHVSVDEGMVGFKGRSFIRQFLPAKRTRYGLKLFILACSDTGYAHTLKLEEGLRPGEKSRKDYGGSVIKELSAAARLEEGSTIYADNWFTSVGLARSLVKNKLHMVGTTRADRKEFPDEVKIAKKDCKKLGRGYRNYATDKETGIRVCSWIDNKVVNMISTRFTATDGLLTKRKAKGVSGGVKVTMPEIVNK